MQNLEGGLLENNFVPSGLISDLLLGIEIVGYERCIFNKLLVKNVA